MCCEFPTQQLGIGPRDDEMNILAKHTVDEKLPSANILHLIKKKILKVTIKLIEGIKDGVEVLCRKLCQTIIVEVGIRKISMALSKNLFA